jgi:mannose-6-phosphate isomerase-like protein (cupin superfamily)
MTAPEPTLDPLQFRISTDIPEGLPKKVTLLCRTDRVVAAVQVIRNGGENNLHSHSHLDGVWTVLAGRARFYGRNDEPMADLGPYEGILIPRGVQYWFESADEDQVLIMHQVEASDIAMVSIQDLINDRINHSPKKPSLGGTLLDSK